MSLLKKVLYRALKVGYTVLMAIKRSPKTPYPTRFTFLESAAHTNTVRFQGRGSIILEDGQYRLLSPEEFQRWYGQA